MGRIGGLIAAVVGLTAAAPAGAQTLDFSSQGAAAAAPAQAGAGLLAPAFRSNSDPARPLEAPLYAPGQGRIRWSTDEVRLGGNDTVRLSTGEAQAAPIANAAAPGPWRQSGFDLSYTKGWPDAVAFQAGGYDVAVSPHAGLGVGDGGGSAEAGAMLRLEQGKDGDDRLRDLGVRDGKDFGDEGRWYLFAAASGRAVGLNMTRAEGGGWNQSGWSTDKTSKLVGDGQLGVGFRKGPMQAAFGYVYREIKVQNGPLGADTDVSDSMAAFSLTIRP